jgi:hypothetical protein
MLGPLRIIKIHFYMITHIVGLRNYLHSTLVITVQFIVVELVGQLSKGRFTPRGRGNSLCKRLEILTCDWSKGSNRSQPLYT